MEVLGAASGRTPYKRLTDKVICHKLLLTRKIAPDAIFAQLSAL